MLIRFAICLYHIHDSTFYSGHEISGYDFIYSEERLKTPLIRENDGFRPASWDEALDLVADRFRDIIEKYGPDSLAGVSCARSINEDSYQMQKLFRAVFRTNNIDHCART